MPRGAARWFRNLDVLAPATCLPPGYPNKNTTGSRVLLELFPEFRASLSITSRVFRQITFEKDMRALDADLFGLLCWHAVCSTSIMLGLPGMV